MLGDKNMITLNEFKSASTFQNVISKLFEARDFTHKAHLLAKSKSYAQHKALSKYDKFGDLVDTLYEVYSGQYGLISFDLSKAPDMEPIAYFEDLGKFCIAAHDAIEKRDTHLHQLLDNVTEEVYHVLYKLKFLK